MVLPDSHQIPRARWYLGILSIPHATDFAYRTITFFGGPLQTLRLSARRKRASDTRLREDPATPHWQRVSALTPLGFRLLPLRSPLLRQSPLISVPAATEMFHFAAFAPATYGFSDGFRQMSSGGLPHSEISGSTPACGSPKLIVACHVLHRRSKPRHPPTALRSLTTRELSARQCSCQ